jgi:hypothetical protein
VVQEFSKNETDETVLIHFVLYLTRPEVWLVSNVLLLYGLYVKAESASEIDFKIISPDLYTEESDVICK